MKITKFVHSCLLVETPDRSVLFDPGIYSDVPVESLQRLDDIIITHGHSDHFDIELVKKLVTKFPDVHITAPDEVVARLNTESVPASSAATEGIVFFDSPHEAIRPLFDAEPPQEIGVHYLDTMSHPGDSHSFSETKAILALPVQAPWGATTKAVALGLELRPQYIIPIHDWHWNDTARTSLYDGLAEMFDSQGIRFLKPINGQPFEIEV